MDYVCNRCLFSIPSKVEMAEKNIYRSDVKKYIGDHESLHKTVTFGYKL